VHGRPAAISAETIRRDSLAVNEMDSQRSAASQRFDPVGRRSFYRVLVVIGVVFAGAMGVQIWHTWTIRNRVVGDGENVASYGYNLSNLSVDPNLVVASGLVKDGQQAMVDPDFHTAEKIDEANQNEFKRAVVGSDMVIGVAINGEARAYPIRILNWHEIVNDTLGGVPIAVTFNPISRAAVVFDRRAGGGQALTFGYSGLLYNHNLLMYDRQGDPNSESLWSQLGFEAIAGPRKGTRLEVLPMRLVKWEQWRTLHPQSKLLAGDRRYTKRYKRSPYEDAFRSGRPRFPVEEVARHQRDRASCVRPIGHRMLQRCASRTESRPSVARPAAASRRQRSAAGGDDRGIRGRGRLGRRSGAVRAAAAHPQRCAGGVRAVVRVVRDARPAGGCHFV